MGNVQHNMLDGIGYYTWSDKKKYIGMFKKDRKHGFGKLIWPDGSEYTGYWKNGNKHGLA